MTDLVRLQHALEPVEKGAHGLAWHRERPWRCDTHLWEERSVPTIDLHDLGRKLALDTVEAVALIGPDLEAGAVRLIVGKGTHSLTGPVLPRVTVERLRELCTANGWSFHADGAARLVWVFDPDRAPPAARGDLPWWIWTWLAAMLLLGLWVCAARLGA